MAMRLHHCGIGQRTPGAPFDTIRFFDMRFFLFSPGKREKSEPVAQGRGTILMRRETGRFQPGEWFFMTSNPSESRRVIEFPREWTDAEILEGIRSGDPAAGRAFFDRYARRINRLVWRLLGADSEHDDIVQEVFANAFASIHQLREAQKLEGWLVGVAVNTVRHELRRRRFRRLFFIFGMEQEHPSRNLDPEHQALAHQFYEMLGRFHPEERIVFILCMVEGMSQPEAAKACGISLSTCKRRLARAVLRASRLSADWPAAREVLDGSEGEEEA